MNPQYTTYELTIPIVVSRKNNEDILHGKDDDDGIEDERQGTEDVIVFSYPVGENTRQDIERRRA